MSARVAWPRAAAMMVPVAQLLEGMRDDEAGEGIESAIRRYRP